uniref:Uncharacterized protein n=1 Tax=Arion vulgaris TaxID=1028688 RepID=A0A0B7B8B1_9EUPU
MMKFKTDVVLTFYLPSSFLNLSFLNTLNTLRRHLIFVMTSLILMSRFGTDSTVSGETLYCTMFFEHHGNMYEICNISS